MRYDREAIAAMHRRAAAWLIAHNFIGEALHHLTAISDYAAVADLIEQQRAAALNELRFFELEAWLDQVPLPLLDQRPVLLVGMAWVQYDLVDNERCLAFVRRARALLDAQSTTLPEKIRQLLAGRACCVADIAGRFVGSGNGVGDDQAELDADTSQSGIHALPCRAVVRIRQPTPGGSRTGNDDGAHNAG